MLYCESSEHNSEDSFDQLGVQRQNSPEIDAAPGKLVYMHSEDMRLLSVFIPILEYVSKKLAGNQTVPLKGIPGY